MMTIKIGIASGRRREAGEPKHPGRPESEETGRPGQCSRSLRSSVFHHDAVATNRATAFHPLPFRRPCANVSTFLLGRKKLTRPYWCQPQRRLNSFSASSQFCCSSPLRHPRACQSSYARMRIEDSSKSTRVSCSNGTGCSGPMLTVLLAI